MLREDRITGDTDWTTPDPPDLGEPELPSCDPSEVLAGGHHPFDIGQPAASTFYSTDDGFTRCAPRRGLEPDELARLTPADGRVTTHRTVAVVHGDDVVRVWPHGGAPAYRLVVPGAGGDAVEVGAPGPVRHAVVVARVVSRAVGVPVLVTRRDGVRERGSWPTRVPVPPGEVTDDTAWVSAAAAAFVPPDVVDCCSPADPALGPLVTDPSDARPGVYWSTNHGTTRCVLDGGLAPEELAGRIPMGYTNLHLEERRAVVHDGEVLRLWARHRAEPVRDPGLPASWRAPEEFRLLVAGAGGAAQMQLTAEPDVAAAVRTAVVLSRRMRATVVVGREVARWAWH